MRAFYNEIDPYCCAWISNLMDAGLITPGVICDKPIQEVGPDEIAGFQRAHWFAGIAVWDYALNIAGWGEREVWTGSCPCQPFSAAGKRAGYADERHLWPHWYRLIRECRPGTIFGEQVAAAVGSGWLDDVCLSLEELGYAVGAVDFPACSVGAPHIRQRLYFVADSQRGAAERYGQPMGGQACETQGEAHERQRLRHDGWDGGAASGLAVAEHSERWPQCGPEQDERDGQDAGRQEAHSQLGARRPVCSVADAADSGYGHKRDDTAGRREPVGAGDMGDASRRGLGIERDAPQPRSGRYADSAEQPRHLGDADDARPQGRRLLGAIGSGNCADQCAARPPRATNGFWADAIWLPCRDGKARPVERATQRLLESLAHGTADSLGLVRDGDKSFFSPLVEKSINRVGRLRGYGNAINAEQAAAFVRAFMECAT